VLGIVVEVILGFVGVRIESLLDVITLTSFLIMVVVLKLSFGWYLLGVLEDKSKSFLLPTLERDKLLTICPLKLLAARYKSFLLATFENLRLLMFGPFETLEGAGLNCKAVLVGSVLIDRLFGSFTCYWKETFVGWTTLDIICLLGLIFLTGLFFLSPTGPVLSLIFFIFVGGLAGFDVLVTVLLVELALVACASLFSYSLS
jgi:hypothetical protein